MQVGILLRGWEGICVDSEGVVSCRKDIIVKFVLRKLQRSKCGGLVSGEK